MCQNSGAPKLSVIIATRNEETAVEHLLRDLLVAGAGEIIVADGSSTDRTAEIAAHYANVIQCNPCRAQQMNVGARASCGEILLFLHADVRLRSGALESIRDAMQDPAVAGGNLDIRYEGVGLAATLFTKMNRWRRRWGIFYGDSGIFCRRSVFEALGGFRPWPILEDYDMARRLWKTGPLAFLDEPIEVSARRWRKGGLPATVWSWVWIQGLYLAGVSPHRLARWYREIR
jgi:rSAM/selenodomain-associated transferase 2